MKTENKNQFRFLFQQWNKKQSHALREKRTIKPRIKSTRYRAFIGGVTEEEKKNTARIWQKITLPEFNAFLTGVTSTKDTPQARALVIFLFYSGRRPSEAMLLHSPNFSETEEGLMIFTPTLKRGEPTTIFLPWNIHTRELWAYVQAAKDQKDLFWLFKYENPHVKRGCDLTYWFKKWQGKRPAEERIPPYFFRHNRFSSMVAAGWTIPELKQFKGAKDARSVFPYVLIAGAGMKEAMKKGGFN